MNASTITLIKSKKKYKLEGHKKDPSKNNK